MFRVPAASVRVATTLTKGDVVSFSYQSFSRKAVPVDPKIVRIRTDLSWKDVVYNYSQETTHRGMQILLILIIDTRVLTWYL